MRKIKKRTPHLSSSWLHRFMGIMIVLSSYLTVFAQTSTSVSVNVGKTKTCYLPTSITGLKNLRTTYVAVSPSYADISSHSKTSVTIKGIKKLQLLLLYAVTTTLRMLTTYRDTKPTTLKLL